jgi:hypothetical protein
VEVVMQKSMRLEYTYLQLYLRKSRRTGNWRKLNFREKAFYRAAMWYAKNQPIFNQMLVAKLLALIEKLKETNGTRIFKRGCKKAAELLAMLAKGEGTGVFAWAPRLKDWLKDPDYLFWLGTLNRL